MKMRDLINLVTESAGVSQLPLDQIAAKFGNVPKWSDTHYKNILYRVTPLSEMLKLAERLDDEEFGPTKASIFAEDFDELFQPFTPQMTQLVNAPEDPNEEPDGDLAPVVDAFYGEHVSVVSYISPDNGVEEYGYVIDGPNFGILYIINAAERIQGWYTGNAGSVLQYLKSWRAKFDQQNQ